MMLAVMSTGIQDTVSWLGSSVGILPRYLELAMTYKSKISCQLVVEMVLSSCLLFFLGLVAEHSWRQSQ